MATTLSITITCLITAGVCTALAERRRRAGEGLGRAALLALYGVCVGVVSTLLVYFFAFGTLGAILLGVPLGVPALVLAAKVSER